MSSVRSLTAATGLLRGRIADYVSLGKPRITTLVLVTTLLGYLLAETSANWPRLLFTLVGTGLVAAGASAFNQVWERDRDARMRRTADRPLPAGRIDVLPATALAFAASLSGLILLVLGTCLLAGGLAAATLLLYVLLYTPLKPLTSLSTVLGAVPGALPPVIGWTAASGRIEPGALVLFAVLFLWQMPHFLAIAWLYRDDYARGGFPLLPVLEPDGASTGRQAVLYAAAVLPVSLALSAMRLTGAIYFAGAALCGAVFFASAAAFAARRSIEAARRLFFTSILYLPALLTLAFFDKVR
jgi:protoheme IX farnesyltransferase